MNIAIIGYGKMGKLIAQKAREKGHQVGLIIDENNQDDLREEKVKDIDVAIEFTGPEAALTNIIRCMELDVPVVSGSTGWLDEYEVAAQKCAETDGAFLYSSNFSVGMNIFFYLNKFLAGCMSEQEDYALHMEEIHHTAKLDAPSGTAITLAEGIMEKDPRREKWVNEPSQSSDVVPIISKREKDVPGTHRVEYTSEVDKLSIEHMAFSRDGFVLGALKAAEWLVGKKGVFSMEDVLEKLLIEKGKDNGRS